MVCFYFRVHLFSLDLDLGFFTLSLEWISVVPGHLSFSLECTGSLWYCFTKMVCTLFPHENVPLIYDPCLTASQTAQLLRFIYCKLICYFTFYYVSLLIIVILVVNDARRILRIRIFSFQLFCTLCWLCTHTLVRHLLLNSFHFVPLISFMFHRK